ncbi:hypothetical protein DL98DRAFT_238255 [Cadophora sp. DSE1049]|nr:hypothetical protein DL98DRAFT_238255 [Cadophora sp. DSE1049]
MMPGRICLVLGIQRFVDSLSDRGGVVVTIVMYRVYFVYFHCSFGWHLVQLHLLVEQSSSSTYLIPHSFPHVQFSFCHSYLSQTLFLFRTLKDWGVSCNQATQDTLHPQSLFLEALHFTVAYLRFICLSPPEHLSSFPSPFLPFSIFYSIFWLLPL